MRLIQCCAIVFMAMLVSCGGGGGSNNGKVANSITVVAGQAVNMKITSNIHLDADTTFFTANSQVHATVVTTTWPVNPASPVIKPDTLIDLDMTSATGTGVLRLHVDSTISSLQNERLLGVIQLSDNTWAALDTETSMNEVMVKLDSAIVRSARMQSRISANKLLRLGLVRVPYRVNVTENKMAWQRSAGNGPTSVIPATGNIVGFVHGMNNGIENMVLAAQTAFGRNMFEACYGLKYPWPNPIEQNGRDLCNLLKQIPAGQQITLIAHSMGGPVIRYALEQDPEQGAGVRAADKVKMIVLLACPNAGTPIAQTNGLKTVNLNNPNDKPSNWDHLGDLVTPSVKELDPNVPEGRAFINLLDQPKNRLLNIPVIMIAGSNRNYGSGVGYKLCGDAYPGQDCDGLVGAPSALHLPDSATLAYKVRKTIAANHSEFVENVDRINDWLDILNQNRPHKAPGLVATVINNGIPANYSWGVTFDIHNDSPASRMINISELIMRNSNANGVETSRLWFDRASHDQGFFPYNPGSPHIPITPGGVFYLAYSEWFDAQHNDYAHTDPSNHRKTLDFYVNGTNDLDQPFSTHLQATLLDKDGSPPSQAPRSVR